MLIVLGQKVSVKMIRLVRLMMAKEPRSTDTPRLRHVEVMRRIRWLGWS